jgi:hypothetical protein
MAEGVMGALLWLARLWSIFEAMLSWKRWLSCESIVLQHFGNYPYGGSISNYWVFPRLMAMEAENMTHYPSTITSLVSLTQRLLPTARVLDILIELDATISYFQYLCKRGVVVEEKKPTL